MSAPAPIGFIPSLTLINPNPSKTATLSTLRSVSESAFTSSNADKGELGGFQTSLDFLSISGDPGEFVTIITNGIINIPGTSAISTASPSSLPISTLNSSGNSNDNNNNSNNNNIYDDNNNNNNNNSNNNNSSNNDNNGNKNIDINNNNNVNNNHNGPVIDVSVDDILKWLREPVD